MLGPAKWRAEEEFKRRVDAALCAKHVNDVTPVQATHVAMQSTDIMHAHADTGDCSSCFARLFGRPRHGNSERSSAASSRLDSILAGLSTREASLTQRASESRADAMQLHKRGDRLGALRALRRAHGIDSALKTTAATRATVEQQQDMLEQAALQKEMSSAISASVKSMQKACKGVDLGRLDKQLDSVADLHGDMATVSDTLASASESVYSIDDDDLCRELEALLENQSGLPSEGEHTKQVELQEQCPMQLPAVPVTHAKVDQLQPAALDL